MLGGRLWPVCLTSVSQLLDDVFVGKGPTFTRLVPVLKVRDLQAERVFYEGLGLAVTYEGEEYPDFIALGSDSIEFGPAAADGPNDPPSVVTWQFGVSDIDAAAARCREVGVEFELERNDPAPGWSYRRLLMNSPSGYRVALEGPNEA